MSDADIAALIEEALMHQFTVGPNMGICAADGVEGEPLYGILREEAGLVQRLADALESATRKDSLTVRTVAELDALPVGSVILNRGLAWQLTPKRERMTCGGWLCADRVYPGVYNSEYAASVLLPATVLWTPAGHDATR